MKLKASFLKLTKLSSHYKELGYVVVHDDAAKVSFNTFDFRYVGNRSRFGQYLNELVADGVDISDVSKVVPKYRKLEPPGKNEELTIVIAKRLYDALVKRTIYANKSKFQNGKPVLTTTKAESWDWSKPAARHSRYYKMAERILKENDHETALRIVNLITGYA